jgi:hypothetical protein
MVFDSITQHTYKSRGFRVRVTEEPLGFLVSVAVSGIGGQKDRLYYRNYPLAEAADLMLAHGLIDAAWQV